MKGGVVAPGGAIDDPASVGVGQGPMYQLEVKRYLVEYQFRPADGWEVTVDVDAMERANGGRHPPDKQERARRAEARDRGSLWFGAALDADGSQQVWFRITAEAVGRMREKTPRARGARLIDALLAWLTPDRQLQPELNRFEVRISEAGDTWIERLRW